MQFVFQALSCFVSLHFLFLLKASILLGIVSRPSIENTQMVNISAISGMLRSTTTTYVIQTMMATIPVNPPTRLVDMPDCAVNICRMKVVNLIECKIQNQMTLIVVTGVLPIPTLFLRLNNCLRIIIKYTFYKILHWGQSK